MRRRADAGVGERDLVLVRLEVGDELLLRSFGARSCFAISVIGTSTTCPTNSKSSSGLNGSVLYSAGAVDMPIWAMSSV